MRATPGQRAALAALAARIDAVWNGIGVVVWAAGVSWKSAEAREAPQGKLDARLQGLPEAVCASARQVWGDARTRPYADTKMVRGWSADAALTVVDEHQRVQQAIVCEVVREYHKAQGPTRDKARERERKRAVQRKKDGVRATALALADAYAKSGEVDADLLKSLAGRQAERPMARDPKLSAWELRTRDTATHVRCPGAGCGAVFSRTRNRCPECGQRRVPDITGASRWSTARQPGWIPLRVDGFTLEWKGGAYVVKLGALGGMTVRLDEPERLAGLAVRAGKLTGRPRREGPQGGALCGGAQPDADRPAVPAPVGEACAAAREDRAGHPRHAAAPAHRGAAGTRPAGDRRHHRAAARRLRRELAPAAGGRREVVHRTRARPGRGVVRADAAGERRAPWRERHGGRRGVHHQVGLSVA